MARILIVVPPLTGHVNPTIAVADSLAAAGHDVAWVGSTSVLRPILPSGAVVLEAGDGITGDVIADMRRRSTGLRGASALQFLWEDFLWPLATAMVPDVDAAADRFEPDVLLVDQQALAGAIVARRRCIPWATSATTSAELVDPLAGLPKVGKWVSDGLARLAERHGLGAWDGPDLRFSEHLVLVFSVEELSGPLAAPPGAGPVAPVGPSLPAPGSADRRCADPALPDGWSTGDVPRLLVSLGTVNEGVGGRFFRVVVEALEDAEVRALLVAPSEVIGPLPEHLVVRAFVPQLSVLAHTDAVVSHGGQNTVSETLAHGLPMVLAPIRDDQPIIAEQAVRAGVARRVRFGRVRAPELRQAIGSVLEETHYRDAAQKLQQACSAAGGAAAAAARLLELAS
ncbi:MAG: glycosyltransferase [Actinomycetota bacterium]|nr:glycosyltransferase [Actinomycetota bacterium]